MKLVRLTSRGSSKLEGSRSVVAWALLTKILGMASTKSQRHSVRDQEIGKGLRSVCPGWTARLPMKREVEKELCGGKGISRRLIFESSLANSPRNVESAKERFQTWPFSAVE